MPFMKRKDNLLDSTGFDWFRSRVLGCHMLYKNDVIRVDRIQDEEFLRGVIVGTGKMMMIPKRDIAGFAALAYPQLGYRRLFGTGGLAVYFERQHNYMRGLRRKSVRYVMTPCSDLLFQRYPNRFEMDQGQREADRVMISVFKPEYDKVTALDDLIDGKALNVILNHDVMIEPSVAPEDDDYVIFFRQRAVGRFNDKKEFKWYGKGYREAVLPLLGNYGVHK